MRKLTTLTLLCVFFSIASFAISPIVGSTTTCVGWTATLSDATPGGIWSSGNPAVATISSSGLVTGVATGTCTITYSVGSAFVTTPFTVNPADVVSGPSSVCSGNTITLSGWPAGGSWTSGTPTVATVSAGGVVTGIGSGIVNIYYTGGGCYAYQIVNVSPSIPSLTGTTTVGTGLTTTLSSPVSGGIWTSSNSLIATVGSGSGIVTGVTAGACTVTYTAGGCYATALITVTTSISPISGAVSTCSGSTATVSATPSGGTWSTSSTSVATINAMGVVSGISAGTVTITYTLGSAYVTRSFTVNATPSVTGSSTVCTGSSVSLSATPAGGTWSSSNTLVATAGSTGIVTGIGSGTANITYMHTGCATYKTITVSPAASISGSVTACSGNPVLLSGSPAGGTWSSSNTTVATVGSTGTVIGLVAGAVTITYTVGSCIATKAMTINITPVITGGSSICTGSTLSLTGSPAGGIWSSSVPTIASAGSTGIISGLGSGTATITYSSGSCYASKSVTVNPVASISGSSIACLGSTTPLSGSPSGGTWSSSATTVVSVSSTGTLTGISLGTATITYAAGSCVAYKSVTVNPMPSVSGGTSVCVAATVPLSGSPAGGIWSSGDTTIAIAGASGIVTGTGSGIAPISYTLSGCSARYTVSVNPVPSFTGVANVCVGTTTTLSVTPGGGSWTSGSPAVATVSSTGNVTGVSPGVVNIYYTASGCYSFRSVTVNAAPAAITGITTIAPGSTSTLYCATSGGVWSSSNTSVAIVGSLTGIVSGIAFGTCNITYSVGGCSVTTPFTVATSSIAPILGSSVTCIGSGITLTDSTCCGIWSSSNPSIASVSSAGIVTGMSTGTATITYAIGTLFATKLITVYSSVTISGTPFVCSGATTSFSASVPGGIWSSSNPLIATINSSGDVTGVMGGVVVISYTYGGCSAYYTLTVNAAPVISGSASSCIGSSFALTATPAGGSWTSGGPTVATVSSTGLVTALSTGVVNIYYTNGGCYTFRSVTVSASSVISGSTGSVCIGTPVTLSATPSGGVWSSSNTTRATISPSGVVTGLTTGTVNISYATGGCSSFTTLTINGTPIIIGDGPICGGATLALTGSFGAGTWSSSNPVVATVSSTGSVTAISAGVTVITYNPGSCVAYKSVTVNATPIISGGSPFLCIGSPMSLTGTPAGGTWSSSNTFRAVVSSSGVVTGLTGGAVTLTYSLGSCYAVYTTTVTSAPIITGSSTVCAGSAISLSGSVTGASWSSGNPSIATVDGSGIVTGVSAGVTNITLMLGGCFSVKMVTVNAAPSISGGSTACMGSTLPLTGTPFGGTWTSSNTFRATVNSLGIVTGLTAGTVNITYSLGSCYTFRTVTVSAGVSVLGDGPVCPGASVTLSGSVGGGSWLSSNPSVATVSTSGIVTGVGGGVVNITYTIASGCYAVKPITVNPGPAPIVGPGSVGIGRTITLTNATPGGTWVSYSPSVAAVGASSGIVTGLLFGSSDIHYWWGGCSVHKTIFVTIVPSGDVISNTTTATSSAVLSSYTSSSKPGIDNNDNTMSAESSKSLKVYPNPSNGNIILSWQNFSLGSSKIVISDITGRRVFGSDIDIIEPNGQVGMSLNNVGTGIYIFTITNGADQYTGKINIQQ